MSVVRTIHEKNYTVVANDLIRDKRLTLKAKGLALLMMSLPDEWKFTERWLATQSSDGLSALRSAIAELEATGYLKRKRLKDDKGKFVGNDYTVFENPLFENPIMDNPITENRTVINTDKQSTDKQNTDTKKVKHKYGQFRHVLLTDDELEKLKCTFNDWEQRIEKLDEGIELKGYKYKNHYLAILTWARNDAKWVKAESKQRQSEYDKFMNELQSIYDEAVKNGE